MKPTFSMACATIVLVVGVTDCRADFMEVTRAATLRAEPTRDSDSLGVMAEGTALPLIDDLATSGYYHVRWESSNTEGWVYRTFVKRNAGRKIHPGVQR